MIAGLLAATLALASGQFTLTRLVTHDRPLVNAWGLAASATGPWWVANEASGCRLR